MSVYLISGAFSILSLLLSALTFWMNARTRRKMREVARIAGLETPAPARPPWRRPVQLVPHPEHRAGYREAPPQIPPARAPSTSAGRLAWAWCRGVPVRLALRRRRRPRCPGCGSRFCHVPLCGNKFAVVPMPLPPIVRRSVSLIEEFRPVPPRGATWEPPFADLLPGPPPEQGERTVADARQVARVHAEAERHHRLRGEPCGCPYDDVAGPAKPDAKTLPLPGEPAARRR